MFGSPNWSCVLVLRAPVEQYLPTSKSPFARCRDHPTIDDLPWRPTSLFTSATRKVHGSADPMRTPMVCCDSIFPREPTCRCTRKLISTKWRANSTNDHARPWDSQPQQRDLTPVLHRSVESAVQTGQFYFFPTWDRSDRVDPPA